MFRTNQRRRTVTSRSVRARVGATLSAVVLGVSTLTGCAAGRISQTADQWPNQDAAFGTVGKIHVSAALIDLPDKLDTNGGVAYPQGSSAPLRFFITNDANEADELTGVTASIPDPKDHTAPGVDVSIDVSTSVKIRSNERVQIGGEGDNAATAEIPNLPKNLNWGFSVPMTFSFANAGDLTMNVPIEIPEERVGPRSSVNLYPAEPTNVWGLPD